MNIFIQRALQKAEDAKLKTENSELADALVELAELLATQEDAIVELAEITEGE